MRHTKQRLLLFIWIFAIFNFPAISQAYLPLHESGDILPKDYYIFGASQQILTDPENNSTITFFGSMAIDDSSQASVSIGTGYTDYHFTGTYKWIPFPDFEKQPAIGGFAGVIFAKPDGESETGFKFGPLTSKEFQSEVGRFDIYGSIPLYLVNQAGDINTSGHLLVGTIFKHNKLDHVNFSAELGLKINDNSFTYISLAATVGIDPEKGLMFY